MKRSCLLVTFCFCLMQSQAQSTTPMDWLIGTWRGEGFGGQMEEVWSAPDRNGAMMGMFRLQDSTGAVNFYEFWVLDSAGLKLKHFSPDMKGWESKDDYVHFEMIETTPDMVRLKGLTYELINNQLKISLDMKYGDRRKTEIFVLSKVE